MTLTHTLSISFEFDGDLCTAVSGRVGCGSAWGQPVRIAALGATRDGPLFKDVWLVGPAVPHQMLEWHPPDWPWRLRQLRRSDVPQLQTMTPRELTDAEVMACGLVLVLAGEMKAVLAGIPSFNLIVSFEDASSRAPCRIEPIRNTRPGPWLELATRRLGWRGCVTTLDLLGSKDTIAAVPDMARVCYVFFGGTWHSRMSDRHTPVAFRRKPTSYAAADAAPGQDGADGWGECVIPNGAPVPVSVSAALPAMSEEASRPIANGVRRSWVKIESSPAGYQPGELRVTEELCVTRPKSFQHAPAEQYTRSLWRIDDAVLSTVDPRGGITQVFQIDRFGRAILFHLDDFDRHLPCRKIWDRERPDVTAGGCRDQPCRAIFLDNVFFNGLPDTYPIALARVSYNGAPPDFTPAEAAVASLTNPVGFISEPDVLGALGRFGGHDPAGTLARLIDRVPAEMPDFRLALKQALTKLSDSGQ